MKMKAKLFVKAVCLAGMIAAAVSCARFAAPPRNALTYSVARVSPAAPPPDANWDGELWKNVTPLTIGNVMGAIPAHVPRTEAKIACDGEALRIIFRVADRYVRAVAKRNQDEVCGDSCVEFFFTPGEDVSKGYFNLELNCGGTMLLRFQDGPQKNIRPFLPEELTGVRVAHSLPAIVDPEIAEPVTWTVECRLPLAILDTYSPVTAPGPGRLWRANLYKCADLTSHPHWVTWSPVDRPQPNFHVPECFGALRFE